MGVTAPGYDNNSGQVFCLGYYAAIDSYFEDPFSGLQGFAGYSLSCYQSDTIGLFFGVTGAPYAVNTNNVMTGAAFTILFGISRDVEFTLTPPDEIEGIYFGAGVGFCRDLNHILVSAPTFSTTNDSLGRIYHYTAGDGAYHGCFDNPIPGKIWDAANNQYTSDFGCSIAMNYYGSVAVIGDTINTNGSGVLTGVAHVYTRSGYNWTYLQTLSDEEGVSNECFGKTVTISSNGSMLAIGAIHATNRSGAAVGSVFIYTNNSDNTFSYVTNLTHLTAAMTTGGEIGYSIAIAEDNSFIVVGAPGTDNPSKKGMVLLYTYNGTTWSEPSRFFDVDGSAGDAFGFSVTISADNRFVYAGAPYDDVVTNGTTYTDAGSFVKIRYR